MKILQRDAYLYASVYSGNTLYEYKPRRMPGTYLVTTYYCRFDHNGPPVYVFSSRPIML